MTNFYLGNRKIIPSFFKDNGGSSSDTVIATNNSSKAVTSGDKVWLNKSGNTYSIIDFSSKIIGGNIVGNPNISMETNLATNFSNGWITVPGAGTIYDATIVTKITTGSNVSSMQEIVRFQPAAEFFISNGELRMWVESANQGILCTSVNSNTTYWIKMVLKDSRAKLSYSMDGITYTGEVSLENYTYNNNMSYIGYFANQFESRPFLGSIDLANTYFIINGNEYYRGITETINPNLSETNSITGKATQNIAIGSSGNVSVLTYNDEIHNIVLF